MQPRALASLSLDLDNEWSYLETHGEARGAEHPSYLDVVVPRVLDVLAPRGLTITWFVVGDDAARPEHRDVLAAVAAAGHEIANHSFAHEPWLHRYTDAQIRDDLARAEDAIESATGCRPVGFRGPGYSLTPSVLRLLAARGYRYDASTLPTVIGPLARAVYLRGTALSAEEREQRGALFGSFGDALRPLRPYRWAVGDEGLVEVPVTVLPVLRVPMHVSYLLWIASRSPALARGYFRAALRLCKMAHVEPSILLHPLDFLDSDDVPSLGFFPGMNVPASVKLEAVGRFVDALAVRFDVHTVGGHAAAAGAEPGLPTVEPGRRRPRSSR